MYVRDVILALRINFLHRFNIMRREECQSSNWKRITTESRNVQNGDYASKVFLKNKCKSNRNDLCARWYFCNTEIKLSTANFFKIWALTIGVSCAMDAAAAVEWQYSTDPADGSRWYLCNNHLPFTTTLVWPILTLSVRDRRCGGGCDFNTFKSLVSPLFYWADKVSILSEKTHVGG